MLSLEAFTFFAQSPGNVIYFLLVILLLQANLLFVNGFSFNSIVVPRLQMYVRGLGMIIGVWLLYVLGALLPLLMPLDGRILLPPLEHAAIVTSVVVFGWLFLRGHDDDARFGVVFWLILIAIVGGMLGTISGWSYLADEVRFSETIYSQLWMGAGFIFSLIFAVLCLLRLQVTPDAPLKMAFFLVMAIGFIVNLTASLTAGIAGDSPGLLRLAYVISLVIVPYIVFRLSQARLQETILEKLRTRQPAPRSVPYVVVEETESKPGTAIESQPMQLLRALGLILQEKDPETIPRQVVQAALETCHGDVAALLRLQDVNYADLTDGFDRSQKRKIPPTSINLKNQPTLVNAIERKTQRTLYSDRNEAELRDLYTRLNLEHVGPVYFQPLLRNNEVVAILLLAMPYAQRELTNSEAELLNSFGIIASDLLQLSYEAKEARLQTEQRTIDAMLERMANVSAMGQEGHEAPGDPSSEDMTLARMQINELTRQVMDLKLKLDDERTRLANMLDASDETLTVSQRIRAINEEQQRLREERDELRRRLNEAETALSSVTTEDNRVVVDRIVTALRVEKDTLQAERERLQVQLDELRLQTGSGESADVQQMINRMIEERSRLEVERDQLSDNLLNIQSELADLGIDEGTSGLAQLIGQLYEQRAELKERSEQLQRERDALLNERKSIEHAIDHEHERDTQISNLQSQIENLAVDRDAVTRQYDKLRAEQENYEEKLNAVKDHRARLLAQTSGLELELDEAHAEQSRLRAEIQNLVNQRSDLVNERDRLIAESRALQTERDQLLARAEGNRMRFQEMSEQGVGSLKEMIDDLTQQRSQLERQLSDVRSRLVESEKQIARLQSQSSTFGPREALSPEQSDMMVSLAQDLRTPMTSILGYLSLLLQESAGILGERQRNFLERIATGVDRLEIMIQDLVQITALDTGRLKLQIEPVSVVHVIEDVMTDTFMQFREKRLALNLDLDDRMAPIPVDRTGLRTVIGQLLTNAYLVSPPGSEITIVAKQDAYRIREAENLRECVFVSVTDQGGGVATDDLEDVFKRRYKATNPLIAGLGDTGVGLAIAKAIVEAHHGRLWITTQEGAGSRLSFVIPIEAGLGFEEG